MRTRKQQFARIAETLVVPPIVICLSLCSVIRGQSIASGSDGSDGALNLTVAGTYLFDPNDVATFGRVLDADGDGVYHFTTITIGPGVILTMRGDRVNRPVYWLAAGAVNVAGQINLNGAHGKTSTNLDQRRLVPVPGPGGYAGGAGGGLGAPSQAGQGPGGGPAASTGTAGGGTFTGIRLLVPLIGGSGGGGANLHKGGFLGSCGPPPNINPSGGAGGGAIAIVSSASITISGTITANGGNGGGCDESTSGAGSGGAIRLVAPSIVGAGALSVAPGGLSVQVATAGRIRLEAFQQQFTGTVQPNLELVSMGTPFSPFGPTASLRVARVNGIALPANPRGTFDIADITINQTGVVTLDIEAKGIPIGTVVNLEVYSENPTDSAIVTQVIASTPLAGTLALSSANASITFPSGYSRSWVRAGWTQ